MFDVGYGSGNDDGGRSELDLCGATDGGFSPSGKGRHRGRLVERKEIGIAKKMWAQSKRRTRVFVTIFISNFQPRLERGQENSSVGCVICPSTSSAIRVAGGSTHAADSCLTFAIELFSPAAEGGASAARAGGTLESGTSDVEK